MPDLRRREAEGQPPGQKGFVTTPPASTADKLTVTVPGFSEQHFYEITRWHSRGATLPAVDDEVLVVFDDKGEPWVPAWWPAGGDAPAGGTDDAKGFVHHDDDPNVARPGGFPSVEWNGIVDPVNAIDTDTWVNPGKP